MRSGFDSLKWLIIIVVINPSMIHENFNKIIIRRRRFAKSETGLVIGGFFFFWRQRMRGVLKERKRKV